MKNNIEYIYGIRGLGWWCWAPLSTIFKIYSVLLVKETGVPDKTIDLSQVTDQLYHIAWAGFEHTTLVVIVTDCIGSCYHTHKTKDLITYVDDYYYLFCFPVYFLLTFVLSVRLRYSASDYPFGIIRCFVTCKLIFVLFWQLLLPLYRSLLPLCTKYQTFDL